MKIPIRLLFLITVVLAVFQIDATAQNPRTKSVKLIVEGDNYMQNGEWQNAIFSYTNAINADQGYALAYMKRATALMRTGQETEAQSDRRKAKSMNPYIEYVYDQGAKLRLLDRDIGWDQKHLNLFLKLNSVNELNVFFDLNEVVDTTSYKERLADIDDQIEEEPEDSLAFLKRALLLYNNRDMTAANRTIQDLVVRYPDFQEAWQVKGMIAYRQYNMESALKSFTRSIQLEPANNIWGQFERAMTYAAMDDYDNALNDFETFFMLNDSVPLAYYSRGHLYLEQGKVDEAIEDFTKAIELNPQDEMGYIHRGQAYEQKEDFFRALSDYEKAAEMNPNNAIAFNLMANMQLMRGEMDEARFHYDRAIDLDAEYAAAYYNRGMARIMTYRGSQGCEDLNEALRLGYERVRDMIPYFCGQFENR
ncbi:tetratricopeptide repeat protein [Halocola ammonii]